MGIYTLAADLEGTYHARMRLIGRWLASLWTAFVGLGACLGFWADLPVSKDALVNAVSAIVPLGAALLPWVVWISTLYFGLRIIQAFGVWVIDLRNDVPSARRFQALAQRVKSCRVQLTDYLDLPSPEGKGEDISQRSRANVEVRMLLCEFQDLGISTPEFDNVQDEEKVVYLISYFTGMERLAAGGHLRHARDKTMHQRYDSAEES